MDADASAGLRLLLGPFPDIPVFEYPVGLEATGRLAWYAGLADDGVERFESGPGWTVRLSAGYLIGSPVQAVFGDVRIGLVTIETGPSVLVGRAVGRGLSVDLTAGAGYYVASYDFMEEVLRAYRPTVQAHLAATASQRRYGLRVTAGYVVFLEETFRQFASVAVAVVAPIGMASP